MFVVLLTTLTLIAFAANSLLCRAALGGHLIDPVSFTTLRLASGALALIPISRFAGGATASWRSTGSWASGFALFAYAAAFSLAYVSLSTGMGALILFGSVQATMMGWALKSGERLSAIQWVGALTAVGGLVYLVLPGLSAPNPAGALLMFVSGASWTVYSVRGKGVSNPVAMTAGNFLRAAPFALVVSIAVLTRAHAAKAGVVLALVSGVVTSGLGYVLWYKTLPRITTTTASLVQLLAPAIAATGGVVFLAERVTARLVAASALILGGVAIAVARRRS